MNVIKSFFKNILHAKTNQKLFLSLFRQGIYSCYLMQPNILHRQPMFLGFSKHHFIFIFFFFRDLPSYISTSELWPPTINTDVLRQCGWWMDVFVRSRDKWQELSSYDQSCQKISEQTRNIPLTARTNPIQSIYTI